MDLNTVGGAGILAAGGILAGVAAGWQQVKNFFNYISSAVVLTVEYDQITSPRVVQHLIRHYKVAPSGIFHIRGIDYIHRNRELIVVPFLAQPSTSIRYGRKRLFIVSGNDFKVTLRALRGTFNVQEFTCEVLQESRQLINKVTDDRANRFFVKKIIGMEKGTYSREEPSKSGGEPPQNSRVSAESSPAQDSYAINTASQSSFMYDKDDYIWENNYDPFASIYFDPQVEHYIKQAENWYAMKQWYADRDIPWRRGWLLYGVPGTGKSVTARAVAEKLGIPIYKFYLSTLSDQEFIHKWDNMERPCIVLFEDIDTVFNKRVSLTDHKSLSFDTILNAISGIESSSGIFLIVTTNRLDYIDEAMGVTNASENGISTRPGRIDVVIHLKGINRDNRFKMAQRVLKDWPYLIESIVNVGEGATPIQFMEMLIQYAYQLIENPDNTKLPKFEFSKAITLDNSKHYDDDDSKDSDPVEHKLSFNSQNLAIQTAYKADSTKYKARSMVK